MYSESDFQRMIGSHVTLRCKNGKEFVGEFFGYSSALDEESGIAVVDIQTDPASHIVWGIEETEIEEIRVHSPRTKRRD